MENNYYLGLDIGTNSVGWAVTDENYNIKSFRGKDLWGIRLFDAANPADDRRIKRANRRRLQRRNQRIDILQELFAKEISKVDENFFIRLNESRLHIEDKSIGIKHPLFADKNYTDIEYYKEYPTIFHLRKELIENPTYHDPRLVYLAIHNLLKHRGHFLIQGDIENVKSFDIAFDAVKEVFPAYFEDDLSISNKGKFEKLLKDRGKSKSDRAKQISALFEISTIDKDKETIKNEKSAIDNIAKLLVGNKGDLGKIFDFSQIELEKTAFSFADADFSEKIMPDLEDKAPEEAIAITKLKMLYDWNMLVDVLQNNDYISFAEVEKYNTHKRNLDVLRKYFKKYLPKEEYKNFFDGNTGASYANWVGKQNINGKVKSLKKVKSQEEFYKNIAKLLTKIEPYIQDLEKDNFERLVKGVEQQNLLPIQRSRDNGVIPYQVNRMELVAILDNAATYLDFLNETDEDGSIKEKIVSLFEFRVPYYVGPLSDRHKAEGANTWIVRKEEGKIYPWNFDTKVDEEKSNEQFIKRMLNQCTYVLGETVLPKQSLLYSKFMVLNELNNLKIRNKDISIELKQEIFNNLFKKHVKVTGKALLEYLQQYDPDLTKEDLSGFDADFKANLSSQLDFEKKVFKEKFKELEYQNIAEDIITWITIYGDDRKMLKKVINQKYPNKLTYDELKAVCTLRYSGWGKLSKTFLTGIEGTSLEDGEIGTIINFLWNTNCNLMQLLNQKYSFKEHIEEQNAEYLGEIKDISYESLIKDLYISPANKRAVWQTIQICEEIKKVMGSAPDKIFVEFARSNEEEKGDKGRKSSRKQQLLDLYASINEDASEWIKEIEARGVGEFNSTKLFLYYLQCGKCMYTGETIDLDELMAGNSKWDRDHIYPQSRIKDDSIDNLVLVKKTENARKDNEMLSNDIQNRMHPFWKSLYEKGLLSKKKFDRLTRKDGFTDEELAGFINRQLVETRQATKAVAELLKRAYHGSDIVYVKAELVTKFRHDNTLLKSRVLNDYHHAKDAYLNIVVGNVYNTKFTNNPLKWIKENRNSNYSINAIFKYDITNKQGKVAWIAEHDGKPGSIAIVKSNLARNRILYTEYTYCEKGQLFDETLAKKDAGSKIPLKKGLDTSKYGGYTSAKTSYFALIEYDGKKNERARQILGVPIYIANQLTYNPYAFEEYCKNIKGFNNTTVLCPKIKKNKLIIVNGFPMRIRGENEIVLSFKGNYQLILDDKNAETLRKVEKQPEKVAMSKRDSLEHDELDDLYLTLADKLRTVYAKRPSNQSEFLLSAFTKFKSLEITDKAKVIIEITNMLGTGVMTTSDLHLIGGGIAAGNMAISKNTVGKAKLVIVNQSVTGIFENRSVL